ncbi:MAG TPA: aminotransferase class I/II-fold pyridoxal phosphate-dependent enzyme [Anseongella sp.]
MPEIAPRLRQTEEYYFSRKLREIEQMNREGEKVINLGIGSPDLPPHPEVVETLCHSAGQSNVHGYQSYRGAPMFRQAISDWYQRYYGVTLDPEKEILPLIGSKEGIMHICMTYLAEGDRALVPNPGYPTYRSAVELSGASCLEYKLSEENGWLPDLEALANTDLKGVKLMWINYPHMPTGTRPAPGFFEKLVMFARKYDILLCHDNPYSFILNDRPESLLAVNGAREIALELNSLSKSGNMAGWRTGMLAGSATFINDVLRFKSNMDSGMFLPVQLAAAKALSLGPEWYAQLNNTYAARREKAFHLLDLIQCTYDRQQSGMFVWAKTPASGADGYALSDSVLQAARVFITPGGIFGSQGLPYIRISLCAPEAVFDSAIQRLQNRN